MAWTTQIGPHRGDGNAVRVGRRCSSGRAARRRGDTAMVQTRADGRAFSLAQWQPAPLLREAPVGRPPDAHPVLLSGPGTRSTNGRTDYAACREVTSGRAPGGCAQAGCTRQREQPNGWIRPATDGSPTPRLLTLLLHEMLCHHHHKPHPPEHEHSRLEAACWGEQMAPRPPASGPSTDFTHGGLQLSAPPGAARGPARPEATGGGLVVRGGQEEKHAGAPGPGPGFAMPVLHTAHVAALTHTHPHPHPQSHSPPCSCALAACSACAWMHPNPPRASHILHTPPKTPNSNQHPRISRMPLCLVPRALPRTPQPQPPAATGSRARALATGETGQGNTRTRDWRPMQIPAPHARQSARRAHAPTRARADAPRTHARTRVCAHARTHAHKQAHKHMTAHTQEGGWKSG